MIFIVIGLVALALITAVVSAPESFKWFPTWVLSVIGWATVGGLAVILIKGYLTGRKAEKRHWMEHGRDLTIADTQATLALAEAALGNAIRVLEQIPDQSLGEDARKTRDLCRIASAQLREKSSQHAMLMRLG